MKITIELDDIQLSSAKDWLRVSLSDFERLRVSVMEQDLAYRILKTRLALGLSNAQSECCYDFIPNENH